MTVFIHILEQSEQSFLTESSASFQAKGARDALIKSRSAPLFHSSSSNQDPSVSGQSSAQVFNFRALLRIIVPGCKYPRFGLQRSQTSRIAFYHVGCDCGASGLEPCCEMAPLACFISALGYVIHSERTQTPASCVFSPELKPVKREALGRLIYAARRRR